MIPRMMTRACATVSCALLLALAAAPASATDANAIVMKNFNFMPMALTVPAGTTVTWTNEDGEPHTVTSVDGIFRSGALDTNDSFKFKFDKPGVYKFLCTIHPRMTGTITVK